MFEYELHNVMQQGRGEGVGVYLVGDAGITKAKTNQMRDTVRSSIRTDSRWMQHSLSVSCLVRRLISDLKEA